MSQEQNINQWPHLLIHWLQHLPVPDPIQKQWQKFDECLTQLNEHSKVLATSHQLSELLQKENTDLRSDQFEKHTLEPLYRTIISIIDRCEQQLDYINTKMQSKRLAPISLKSLRYLKDVRTADLTELKALLMLYGVEKINSIDPVFNPRKQQCCKRIPTDDQLKMNRIKQFMLTGYCKDDRIIRAEQVAVYTYAPPAPELTPTPETSENPETLELNPKCQSLDTSSTKRPTTDNPVININESVISTHDSVHVKYS